MAGLLRVNLCEPVDEDADLEIVLISSVISATARSRDGCVELVINQTNNIWLDPDKTTQEKWATTNNGASDSFEP